MSTMTDTQGRRPRRSFTDDYKTGAVRLVLDEGKTAASAARDLGLTESSLRNWVEQARADRTKGKTGLTTAEREELPQPEEFYTFSIHLTLLNRISKEIWSIFKNVGL